MHLRSAVVVNPSPDIYGADLQMLQTVLALVESGWGVTVIVPEDGELVPRIRQCGANVIFVRFPVLRKGNATPGALLRMLLEAIGSVPRSLRLLRDLKPSVLIVNTVTLPWWLLAGRLSRTPTIGHLHEAETEHPRLVRKALVAPLFLAHSIIVISRTALAAMTEVQPRLARRAQLIYNGVPQPPDPPADATRAEPIRLAVIGRLSPRKGPHLALEAVGRLRAVGYNVTLDVAGSTFPGYEWYEAELRERAERPDLRGAVEFSGYCSPVWPVLQRADIVLAPSTHEPFGNVVVEAQMCRRPVVAAASYGHLESIVHDDTGLLVPAGDPDALAGAVKRLITDPELADRVARNAETEAVRRFSVERYRREVADLISRLVS
jgi:glycosyltransferase involved in cell wall biosynthesis